MGFLNIGTGSSFKPKRKSKKVTVVAAKPKYKPEFKDLVFKMPAAYRTNDIPSLSDPQQGVATRQDEKRYTGNKLIGIGVLHKSCLQPIFSEEQAVEIATMRR
jgi:hypothetical protein